MKNYTCSKLGGMLYLEIHNRKKARKIAEFQMDIGGTEYLTKRRTKAKKECGQL